VTDGTGGLKSAKFFLIFRCEAGSLTTPDHAVRCEERGVRCEGTKPYKSVLFRRTVSNYDQSQKIKDFDK
jgi:hypothetical protein